jgi:Cof subfamily protein (haloacid dehalogenase superfamily)
MISATQPSLENEHRDTNMKIRLIALDIDGTILDRQTNLEILPELRDAVMQAQQHGITVTLCTSRMSYALEDTQALGLSTKNAIVAASGAEVLANNSIVQRSFLPPELWQLVLDIGKRHDLFAALGTPDQLLIRQQGQYDPATDSGPSYVRVLPDDQLHAALKTTAPAATQPLVAYLFDVPPTLMNPLRTKLTAAGGEVVASGNSCLLTTAKAVDKGQGLRALAAHLGVSAQEIMAVGNDFNDLPMFAAAGLAIAVGNAPAAVQAAANQVVADVWHGGAAQAIRDFAL